MLKMISVKLEEKAAVVECSMKSIPLYEGRYCVSETGQVYCREYYKNNKDKYNKKA